MKEKKPKFPWCTAVPRPTLIVNMDAEEAIISYFTAPIFQPNCRTAVIKLKGLVRIESQWVNDEENAYLGAGFNRDVIHVEVRDKYTIFLFLFHNEMIKATAFSLEEIPGEDTLMENLKRHLNPNFERD